MKQMEGLIMKKILMKPTKDTSLFCVNAYAGEACVNGSRNEGSVNGSGCSEVKFTTGESIVDQIFGFLNKLVD